MFRTAYGPEIPSIHRFISERGSATLSDLEVWFVQGEASGLVSANLLEGLGFLTDIGLVRTDEEYEDLYLANPVAHPILGILKNLSSFYSGLTPPAHALDPWFMGILDRCFIRPNRSYIGRLHSTVNSLELPVPCSEEKINAWRRVMEFLGCGRRIQSGFLAVYSLELVSSLLRRGDANGPLQDWLDMAAQYVPVFTATGGLANMMVTPLLELERQGYIRLEPRGDFAGRAYFGERRAKWLVVGR